ncbi:PREDICTED: stearoyl-CoA desaturase 5-like [Nicrophorus vespilloides]|uniref:Stearoyl-CoA desaturase 5-like n=1 Tax=Nicrophorus vespilloides TaxID=110193 RepID=A0ABM1MXE4_NICVS|nr:PREDICTED: stearoyl-CoA desaturase 5-like [Nicrophorus vespilloides]
MATKKQEELSRIGQNLLGYSKSSYRWEVVWKNVIIFSVLHALALRGLYLYIFKAKIETMIFFWMYSWLGGFGITAGAHRLWSHRSYKAKTPLRYCLAAFQCIAVQNHLYEWCRDHRVHHKFSETDADPHNAKRGFFFSHIGWLLLRKHPDVREKGKFIDMSDIAEDPVIKIQKKYYTPLVVLFRILVPLYVDCYLLGEKLGTAFYVMVVLSYIYSLHVTWLVNSAAHLFGNKPYDQSINPSQNRWVSIASLGEGWHNFHHVFPWDYKANELPFTSNWTTRFIHFWAALGQAYDLKSVSAELIKQRATRTGDGSLFKSATTVQ